MKIDERTVLILQIVQGFKSFFNDVRLLYNLALSKKERANKVEAIKKYSDELFKYNYISEYIYLVIKKQLKDSRTFSLHT